jgi:hypothetical protein
LWLVAKHIYFLGVCGDVGFMAVALEALKKQIDNFP